MPAIYISRWGKGRYECQVSECVGERRQALAVVVVVMLVLLVVVVEVLETGIYTWHEKVENEIRR